MVEGSRAEEVKGSGVVEAEGRPTKTKRREEGWRGGGHVHSAEWDSSCYLLGRSSVRALEAIGFTPRREDSLCADLKAHTQHHRTRRPPTCSAGTLEGSELEDSATLEDCNTDDAAGTITCPCTPSTASIESGV